MGMSLGDFDTSAVIYGKFTTYRPSTGAAFTLGGTPALSVYKDNSTTQSTTGVTLTADFDTVTGLNHFAIDTSADGAFYAAGSFFDIVITTGTVDSVSVVGSVVGSFTLRKNSALKTGTNSAAVSFTGGMTISNASGTALTLSSSGSNGNGLATSGNGTGDGIAATGGATGRGIHAVGGATSGAGIRSEGTAGNSNAMELLGQGSANGLTATGGATGIGISAVGGATSGSAIKAVGTNGNAIALELVGQGSAAGLKTTGGATGNGATFAGGATSGHGLQATTVGSNEIDADITGTLSAVATGVQTAIAGKVWDEATSGHVTAGSFGAQLQAPHSGTAQAGAATTITLAAGASAVNDYYKNDGVYILSGTGAGQFRFVSGYVGATKVATVATWGTNPDATSVYTLIPFGAIAGATAPTASENAIAVWEEARSSHTTAGSFGQYFASVLRGGTAQAGTSSSITLDSGASATNDLYKYNEITIIGGTGAGQSRQCNGYTGSSKVATVGVNWTVAPSSDSVFLITPLGVDAATVAAIASAVWEETRAAHSTAGTMGEYVTADAQRIKGDATAATNAKNAFDGSTGYGFTACTMPTVTAVTTVNGLAANSVTASAVAADAVTEIQSGLATSAALTSAAGDITTILGQTGTTGVVVAAASKTGYTLSNAGIDALFTRQLTESYAADGAAPTLTQSLMLIQQLLGDFSISGTTLTLKKVDGSTTAATFTLNSASAPTSITRAT